MPVLPALTFRSVFQTPIVYPMDTFHFQLKKDRTFDYAHFSLRYERNLG